jgi:hypothetical protein
MSNFAMFACGREFGPLSASDAKSLEYFMATGLGSRGGPNKVSNKLKRTPLSYLFGDAAPKDYLLATGLRSRGGPNKVSNKLRRSLGSYLYD